MGTPKFIRTIWGNVSEHRNGKIAKEISSVKNKTWFTVYTFGEKNHEWLKSLGFDSVLFDKNPIKFDLETEMYRHKLDALLAASHDLDEFTFLDWDCVPVRNLTDVWKILNQKESFQANLFQYRTKKCLWRKVDPRKVCNGGFLYVRDKSIPQKFINNWNGFVEWTKKKKEERAKRGKDLRFREKCLLFDDEPAISKYIDDYFGEWCGPERYWEVFEPEVCNLKRKSAYPKEMLDKKNACFIHNL